MNGTTNLAKTKEKILGADFVAAWRQRSLLASEFVDYAPDVMDHRFLFPTDNALELESRLPLSSIGIGELKFPSLLNHNSCAVQNESEIILKKQFTSKNEQDEVIRSTPRNSMDQFLEGQPNREQSNTVGLGLYTAKEVLALRTMRKNGNSEWNSQRKGDGNVGPTVDFNFAATKRSLGSFGRFANSTKKSFVSPVREKASSTKDTAHVPQENADSELDQLMTHAALKNIDPKMVDMINNEIMHKFRPVDWNEIAGLDYAKAIIKEAVVFPLLRPDIFTGLRRPPRGILLFGPPGTGKTLIGKCIASQSKATFFSISSAALTSKWMGEGEKMVRTLFAVAVARQPSVIFIDEIDSVLSRRSESENEGTRRLKTEFLVRLDGAATSDDDRVLIVGATNRPQELDEAVRRRFIKRLYVPLPEMAARMEILTNLLRTVDNSLEAQDLQEIATLADGYSGADMDSLCREASMEPLRSLPFDLIMTFSKENLRPVNKSDFLAALKKIRPSVSQNDLDQYMEWNKTYGSSS